MGNKILYFCVFGFLLSVCFPVAQEQVTVGVKEAPPFTFKNADGEWEGITIDIWNEIKPEFDNATLSEMTLEDLIKLVKGGGISTGLGAISITDARERVLDFSIPYFESGLAVASKKGDVVSLNYYMTTIGKVLKALTPWVLLLCVVGVAIWFIEKKSNEEEFHAPMASGIGSGIWWACVTMTTVGYGDKTPKSCLGRLLGVFWMFSGIVLISSLTATITSTMTLDRLNAQIEDIEDLRNKRVGVIQASSSFEYLDRVGINSTTFESLELALGALNEGEIEYVVHDMPIMQYTIKQNTFENLEVLDFTLNKEFYGFPVTDNSPLVEQLNIGILEAVQSGRIDEIIRKYIK